MTVMSQRMKVKEVVIQMHEKNLVLMNILRDIAENETSGHFGAGPTDDEIARCFENKTVRRKEIFGEIVHVLRKEDMARRVAA